MNWLTCYLVRLPANKCEYDVLHSIGCAKVFVVRVMNGQRSGAKAEKEETEMGRACWRGVPSGRERGCEAR
jgi:hypothetical protein